MRYGDVANPATRFAGALNEIKLVLHFFEFTHSINDEVLLDFDLVFNVNVDVHVCSLARTCDLRRLAHNVHVLLYLYSFLILKCLIEIGLFTFVLDLLNVSKQGFDFIIIC